MKSPDLPHTMFGDFENDFKAEVVAAEMVEHGTASDRILILMIGAMKRTFRKDVEFIAEELSEYDHKEYVLLKTPKEGIYDISGSFNEDSDNHHGKTLDVGYYVIWVYCNYDDCSEPKHESYQIRFFCNNEFKCRQVGMLTLIVI